MGESELDILVEAFKKEQDHWGLRVNKVMKYPYEVFRDDDADPSNKFSELHSYATLDEGKKAFVKLRDRAAMRAALRLARVVG